MKQVMLTATWQTVHTLEVPDDWSCPGTLDEFTEEQLDSITSQNAELIDWGTP